MAEQPSAPQPVQQAAQGPAPTLQEGYIQVHQGYLQRRTTILKRWKKQWFSVVPGHTPQTHAFMKHGRTCKPLHLFPTANPNVVVEPLSIDPKKDNLMAFRIISCKTQKELSRFRAANIVQMRKFMASLGGARSGLFTKKTDSGEVLVEATHGLWDVLHPSEDELAYCQQFFDSHGNKESVDESIVRSANAPPTYAETIQQLPVEFYFPGNTLPDEARAQITFPGTAIPQYNPAVPILNVVRRPWHDTFRPPHGPPSFYPVSIGYGTEIGLESGLQALWDPSNKIYFFLDHIRQITFYEDPRPPVEPRPVVQKQQFVYGDRHRESSFPRACNDHAIIEATARSAHSKPHGFTLYACGVHGNHGSVGRTGQRGAPGSHGIPGVGSGLHGGRGGDGYPGGPGCDGGRGENATDASDVIMNVWGDANELHVAGTTNFTAQLGGTKAEEVLFVTCRGGDGGHGGRGGDGGVGGNGGLGGDGAQGQHGISSRSGHGGNGGPGGNGGDGGNGGPGGPGGRGRDGGDAGCGGMCVIQAADPRLLVLVEVDCMNGAVGKGASGGVGGRGGFGGSGGSGGPGGLGGSSERSRGYSGPHGFQGRDGNPGIKGRDGQSGFDGRPAPNGAILWVVSSPDGGVLYQSGTRYDAEVMNLHIASAINDGIFEPNERIMVSGVLVVNSGGLPLPSGSSAFIPSTKTIKFEPTRFEVPGITPNQTFMIPITFYGRIFDQLPPNVPGPFTSRAKFHPRIELLGRPFRKSFLRQRLMVQYPVKLAYLRCNENLGRGEVSVLEIGVQNISTMPYGSCPGGGEVVLQIHLDARLIPIGSANISFSSVPYTITYDPNIRDSTYIQLHEIPSGETVNVQINIQVESCAELFDRCYWQADLYLRGKLIEYNFEKIRVSPFYIIRDPPSDVLMVTDSAITRKEFVFWQRILESLNVSVDFWDTVRYNGLSVDFRTNTQHQVLREGRYTGRMILYPHTNINMLWGIDIARHFHGPNYRDGALEDLSSSMVLFMPPSPPHDRHSDPYCDRGDMAIIRHLSAVDGKLEIPYRGMHLTHPGTHFVSAKLYHKWEKKQLKKLEREVPSQASTVIARQVNIQSTGIFRYSYGDIDFRCIPILRSCKLLVIDGAGGSMVDMSLDDVNLVPSSNEIPLASNFGQVYLATVFGLPTRCKLALFKTQPEEATESPPINFTSGFVLTKAEVVMICAASEMADEVYSCTGTVRRIAEFAQEIENNTSVYTVNGRVILRGMELVKMETKKRKKQLSNSQVSRAISETNRHISHIQRALHQAGVDRRNLEPLLRLKFLLDCERVHRSHQHQVKDKRWNLAAD